MPVYKGRDGRRSDAMTISKGEVEGPRPMALGGSTRVQASEAEGSRPMALGAACACTSLRSQKQWFWNYHSQNQGACVIAII
jgi:hypothetical protein